MRYLISSFQAVLIFNLLATSHTLETREYCTVFTTGSTTGCQSPPSTFLRDGFNGRPQSDGLADNDRSDILENAFAALAVLQNEYFDPAENSWPTAIDWTAAVTETVVAGMLKTLSTTFDAGSPSAKSRESDVNLISTLYDQIISSFFGQRSLEIEQQAFDDMQWVVLGWIEAATFAEAYGQKIVPSAESNKKYNRTLPLSLETALTALPWHGHSWLPLFFKRARTFWQLASAGWDTKLCHGGMNWNPRLLPYKNAITNELWVSSSISMYQYYRDESPTAPSVGLNKTFLDAAVDGYNWLMGVNMTNSQELFVDGFHISSSIPNNVECNERDEMVYTYNQGVLLTGQRGLFTVTGNASYLSDGHKLIQSVVKATGWDDAAAQADAWATDTLPPFSGLGRGGILEDQCDASGTCSQDGQTFKGIFFHHLTAFCGPLDVSESQPFVDTKSQVNLHEFEQLRDAHTVACQAYLPWVRFNANAALKTRDSAGRFGMWWGAALWGKGAVTESDDGIDHSAVNTTDYRNFGTPRDDLWGRVNSWHPGSGLVEGLVRSVLESEKDGHGHAEKRQVVDPDPNHRGRGRTVETQVGGLALLRAFFELAVL
ncbi:Mannan endo-1 [Escovopsis weberi]|uniref:Mannan endo-1 n=1 Tax=Escovopsis weberi TaxID=150374 RepID=A0A0M8N0W7_ESCWE|nr:Mannan endo-1 [Escovopsis weberi]